MRTVGAFVALMIVVLGVTATPGSSLACDADAKAVAAGSSQLTGRIAALLTAEVVRPGGDAAPLGVTLLVESDSRLVTVVVAENAEVIAPDGASIAAGDIAPAVTVLLIGRWTDSETFEATRIELR